MVKNAYLWQKCFANVSQMFRKTHLIMITYKFYIDKRTINSANEGSLKLRLVNNRRKAEIGLGILATEKQLQDAMSERPSPAAKRLVSFIELRKAEIDKEIISLLDAGRGNIDVKELCTLVKTALKMKEETDKTFLGWFQKFTDEKSNAGTRGIYNHTISRMNTYDPQLAIRKFEDIDLKWLTGFEAFCAKTASKNARNIHLRNIRAVFNNAIDYEITTAYPFRRFKIRPEETRKRSMQVEELRKLFDYPVEPYAEIYRDMFKLIFMLCGINTVDLWGLKSITKDGRIEYKRAKTGRLYSIKVEPEAMEIIEKYRGEKGLLCIADRWSDHRNFRHQLNKALQRIGQVERKGRGGKKIITSEFEDVSSYWARHTWSTIAADLNVPDAVISSALGHAAENATTAIYIRRNQKKVDDANRKVIDWVLYGMN